MIGMRCFLLTAVAVVIATVVSWTMGFERDHDAQLVHIRSPQVNKRIQMYNAVEDVLATKGTEKVRLGTEKREARQTRGHGSADVVALQGRMSLLNVGIESLREISADLRHQLRDARFKATVAADGERYFGHFAADLGRFGFDLLHDPPGLRGALGAFLLADRPTFRLDIADVPLGVA